MSRYVCEGRAGGFNDEAVVMLDAGSELWELKEGALTPDRPRSDWTQRQAEESWSVIELNRPQRTYLPFVSCPLGIGLYVGRATSGGLARRLQSVVDRCRRAGSCVLQRLDSCLLRLRDTFERHPYCLPAGCTLRELSQALADHHHPAVSRQLSAIVSEARSLEADLLNDLRSQRVQCQYRINARQYIMPCSSTRNLFAGTSHRTLVCTKSRGFFLLSHRLSRRLTKRAADDTEQRALLQERYGSNKCTFEPQPSA